jgi:hypothetical protein
MAVPRPVLLALIGLGLVASVFLVTRNGSNDAVTSSSNPAARPAVAPSAPAKAARPGKGHARSAAPARPAKQAHAARRAATPKPSPKAVVRKTVAPAGSGVEARVLAAAQALGQDQVVVFFFSNPGAADDVGARVAVKSLRGMPRVQVFDASLDEVAAYRPMLSSVGISQIPSTVIVRPGKKAILLQGFVDAGTLRQNVADALR